MRKNTQQLDTNGLKSGLKVESDFHIKKNQSGRF